MWKAKAAVRSASLCIFIGDMSTYTWAPKHLIVLAGNQPMSESCLRGFDPTKALVQEGAAAL